MTRTCHGTVISVHTGAVTSAPLLTAPVPPAPMLASTGALPTDTSAYCYEVKWDGILH
jgi:ATP-dependent DNA ligase